MEYTVDARNFSRGRVFVMAKKLRRLHAGEVRFLLVDIQEKLFPHIHGNEEIRENSLRLLAAARLMDIPFFYTEQYPKGIGATDAELAKALPPGAKRFEKLHFSCMDEPGFKDFLQPLHKNIATVVWGIETHICIETTVMDMLDEGMEVAVVSDAVGSRTPENREVALEAMRRAGALVLSTESVVYQLLGKAGTEQFKAMLPFFK